MIVELLEFKQIGFKTFESFWNKIDFALIITWSIDFYFKWSRGFAAISTDVTPREIFMTFIRSSIVILVFFKMLSYLRSYEQFGMMVSLLKNVLV